LGKGHHQRSNSSSSSRSHRFLDLLRSKFTFQWKRLVRIPFLTRLIVPFATISTASLIFTFDSAKAATIDTVGRTLLQRGDVTKGIFSGAAIAERGGGLGEFKHLFENLDAISSKVMKALDWFNNLPISIPKLTADLLTKIYHFLSKVALETPIFIFNNPYLKNTSLTFALISITLVTIFTIVEALLQMFNKQHTDFHKIMKRWIIVASISGFVPFLFENGFDFLNKLSNAITHIGMNGGDAKGLVYGKKVSWFNSLVIILFDITAISMLIPICLQAGRRWFDLLILCAISPLALSAYCFDRHKHYFDKWWDSVKTLGLSQLVFAVYILLLGIIIFGTQGVGGGFFTLVVKIVIVLAGLNKLANPPQFIKRMTDTGTDVFDEYDKTKKTFSDIYDTLTLKNFRPLQFMKQKSATKQQKVKALQKKHGRRYVSNLL
jgi:hypothetical protein